MTATLILVLLVVALVAAVVGLIRSDFRDPVAWAAAILAVVGLILNRNL